MNCTIAAFILLSLTFSTIHSLFPVGDRAVIIRIDDVQTYDQPSSYAQPEKMLLQYHITEGIPALVSIIPTRFDKDPQLVDQIKEGTNQGIFTIAVHGWHHEPFTNLSRTVQAESMQYGKNRLEAILGSQVLAFVPPYDKFNRDTIAALKISGLTLMSSATYEGDIPREEDGIVFIPQTVTSAEVVQQTDSWNLVPLTSITQQIESSWVSYGVAVIVIHPRQFYDEKGEDRWSAYIQMIEWIQQNQGKIIRAEPPRPTINLRLDPFLLSVGIFTGLVSTLLIAFNLSSKRNARKISRSDV